MEEFVFPNSNELDQILRAGIQAPSGDNCQPWIFKIRGNFLELYNAPERDTSLYSYNQRSSLISHGALLFNIKLVSQSLGYGVKLEIFPDENRNHIANIYFFASKSMYLPETDCIYKRVTNRKQYNNRIVSESDITFLKESLADFQDSVNLYFVEGTRMINRLAEAASKNEDLVLTNKFLHEFLFKHVRWSEGELKISPDGLYIKTLEMNFLQRIVFRIASNWGRITLLNRIGLNKKVADENKKTYQKSAVFGLITVKKDDDKNFLAAGELLQKIWLRATSKGIYLHPVTGIVFLNLRVKGDKYGLDEAEANQILEAYNSIQSVFNPSEATSAFMFRLGYADAPSATTPRFPLERFIENNK